MTSGGGHPGVPIAIMAGTPNISTDTGWRPPMNIDLSGKSALVTGSTVGIGYAIAKGLAGSGASVVLNGRKQAGVDAAVARLKSEVAGSQVRGIGADVSTADGGKALVAALPEVDILVNNAGIFNMGPISEITEEDFDRQFGVNVRGLVFVTKAISARMIEQGRGGKIINMSSQAGRRGEANVLVYCASKAAVISITQSMGLELIKHRINVNGIAPGVVDTPMWDRVDSLFAKYENRPIGEKKRLVGEAVPYGRMGVPEDYRGIAVFLASQDSDYIVAQTFNVDGGNWMS
jgi:D-sorbitol dehydrogenase (acceptor)